MKINTIIITTPWGQNVEILEEVANKNGLKARQRLINDEEALRILKESNIEMMAQLELERAINEFNEQKNEIK